MSLRRAAVQRQPGASHLFGPTPVARPAAFAAASAVSAWPARERTPRLTSGRRGRLRRRNASKKSFVRCRALQAATPPSVKGAGSPRREGGGQGGSGHARATGTACMWPRPESAAVKERRLSPRPVSPMPPVPERTGVSYEAAGSGEVGRSHSRGRVHNEKVRAVGQTEANGDIRSFRRFGGEQNFSVV
ncbi:hypothetical protein TRVL_08526 [Trypanosoma vivax]|nr:hypothetical protein TRVL_08526 [Trypanosoma vivax]